MADYSIELGVELRTTDIDTKINDYNKKNKLINVKADLDASDIINKLNAFKGKAIDVNTKLSTKGITKAIRAYKAPKMIHLESDLDTDGITKKIESYPTNKTINVDVSLNSKSINQQIQNAKPTEQITVQAKLDDDAITEAINSYKTVKPIPIKIEPDFSELNFNKVEELLKGYEARTPLKVNAQLNKTAINNVISEFNTELKGDRNRDILLQVKLTDGAVAEAVSKYKASDKDKLKIPLDLDLKTSTEFDTKIKQKRAEYEKDPILIPAKLIQASKGFSSAIQKTPISIEATLKNPQEISNEISKYIEKPVPVKAQLVPTKGFDSNITKTPIKVHATLLPEEINGAITNFKPSSKINVGVKLNPADINTEVSKLPKPTQPLEVDVNLTKASVNKAITNTKATSLLKVGIDLQTEDINAQIEKINPTSKVNVRLDLGDNINEEVKKQSSQVPIDVNVRLDREDINKQIREFKTNTKFKVGVKLDFASHQGGQKGVPQQIKDYKTNTKIKVGVQVDPDSANQAVQSLTVNAPIPLRIELEANSVQNVNNQIDNIRRQIEELGNIRIDFGGNTRGRSIGATAGAYQRAYREVYNIHKQIESMELKLGSLDMSGVDYSNISQYRAQLDSLRQTYQTLLNTLNGDDINLDAVFNDIDQARTMIAGLLDSVDNARTKLAKDIKLDIDSGSLQSKVDAVAQKFDKLGVKNRAVSNDITELQRLLSNMDRSDDIESITSDYQTFLQLLKTVKSAVNDLQMEMDAANRPEILEAKKEEAAQRLNGLFEEGSQAAKVFGERAEELRRELNNVGNVKGVDIVNKKIKNLGTEIKNSKLQTQTLGSRLKEQLSRYSNYLSIASVFMYGMQAARSMFEQVKLIDSAMTELKKVTDETDESYNKFLNNAASRAKEIGTTIDGLVSSTADFARLGYSFEDSQGLAEVANIYAVVGDEIEGVEGATESLISTMAAFKDQAEGVGNSDFAMSIIDKFNEIGNKFAISSGGIGEAMMRSASSLNAANNTIDESIALITAANTVVQNPDKVGNAFKTISMRIRGAKTELEEAGESTEGMAESTATMRKEIMALSGVDIMLNEDTFKSTYQIMDELSNKWENLSDIAQASIIELMAGKHQGNVFASLMQNFDTAREALEVSAGSAGSAMQEHAKWSESLEARLLKLKASWQSLSQTFMKSDFLKVGIDFIIKLIDFIDKLIDKIGVIPTILGGLGLFKIFKAFKTTQLVGGIRGVSDVLSVLSNAFPNVSAGADKFIKALKGVSGASASTGGILSKLTAGLGSVISPMGGIALAAAATIGVMMYGEKKIKDLADSVEETTSKYKEQHEELLKLKDDYDTSNEDSLISKYEKLSKGVDSLGENISLTSDEYAEYKSIVDTIANQFPNLVTGYNSQGAAVLDLADGVNTLTQSYKDLILEQNRAVLNEGNNIFNDFNNDVNGLLYSQGVKGMTKGHDSGMIEQVSSVSHLKALEDIFKSEDLEAAINNLSAADAKRISDLLEENGLERDVLGSGEKGFETYKEFIIRAVKENKDDVKSALTDAWNDVNAHVEDLNTYTEAYFNTAFLGGDNEIGDYSHFSDKMQNIMNQIISGFGVDFYEQFNNVEELDNYLDSILTSFNSLGADDIAKLEASFNLRTQFNNGDIDYGDYVAGIKEAENLINGIVGLDDNIKNQIKLSLNTEEVEKNYNALTERLKEIGIENQEEFLSDLTASEYSVFVDIVASGEIDLSGFNSESFKKYLEDKARLNDALNFKTDIKVDKTSLESFNTALQESASAMGLTSESIDILKSKYSELESFDADILFEKTANGVKLNREEVARLEKEYKDLKKTEVQEHLDTLADEYNRVTEEIDKCTNAGDRAKLFAERDTYANKIKELATYQAQLEGVTGAYQRWLDAQNTPEDYEGYQAVATGREDVEDEISRGLLGNASKEYIDLLSGEDLQGKDIDTYAKAWERLDDKITSTGYSIHDFFTINDDGDITSTGIDRFFESIKKDIEGIYNADTGIYDFSEDNLKKIQDEYGMGIEAIELLLESASAAGYDIDWGGIFDDLDLDVSNLESLVAVAENAQKELNKLEDYKDIDFNFSTTSVEDATYELDKAQKVYDELVTNDDGTININAKGADNARVVLATLLVQKQQLEDSEIAINISTTGLDDSQAKAVAWVQDFRTKYKNLEIAISTGEGIEEAKTELENVKASLGELDGDTAQIAAQLVLGKDTDTDGDGFKTQVNNAIDSIGKQNIDVGFNLDDTEINNLNSKLLNNFTVDATAKITNVDKSQLETVETGGMVTWDENVDGVTKSFEADGTVNWNDNINNVQTSFSASGTVNWTSGNKVKVKVVSEANGTANANGTTGRAFKQGNWGIKGSGNALVGELGMETLVRDGHFYTIGDNGAEFINYKQGDIIFNHKQTEELFKNGKVTSDGGRGKMFANGSAFVNGAYPSSGRAFWDAAGSESAFASDRKDGSSNTYNYNNCNIYNNDKTSTSTKSSSKSSSSSSSSSKDATNEFKETIDWIEVAISRIEREIDNLDQKANNVYQSWSSRNSALTSQISEVGSEIELQQKAYNRYMQEANSVGLSEEYASKVRNGTIDIETITDEALKEKITDYQTWYEKAIACQDEVEKLKEEESELYKQRFDNVSTQYDGILGVVEHEKNMLEEYINQSEAQAWLVSGEYYNALANNERGNIDQLEKQKASMLAELQNAMESGTVVKGSEAWYDMVNDIDDVTLSIAKGKTRLLEYEQTLQQLGWEPFDLLHEKISAVSEESEFLIDLLSSDKLYDDNGQLTDSGMATMGLHGQNYNVNMYQADMYGAEAERLRQELEKDPFDTDLEARYREMISLQQEHITKANEEKEAIRDMVEEGINLELDALQERIDKYNEALDSQKDLYDYQKNVKEQTEEIASLEKQLSAYAGDNSEEAKAKVQELKVSLEEAKTGLEETEYEKYISDQQALLDELYLEYETILNTRLDKVDLLLSDMISEINADATSISNTLSEKAGAVGYELSESMSSIWSTNSTNITGVITNYGTNFLSAQTTTNNALSTINTNLQSMITQLNSMAKTKVKSASVSSAANSKEANSQKTQAPAASTSNQNTNTNNASNKSISVGGTIDAGSAKIYDYAGDTSGERQLYRNDPKYKVLKENGSWIQVRWHKLSSGITGWFKKGDVKAYKSGVENLLEPQVAWTQENGKEFVVRPSDGAILTPLAKGDSVLNANASRNIWDMANSPSDFIRDNLNLGSANIPNNSNVQNNYTQNIGNVVFDMENVKNYDEMLSMMQKDKNFERLLLSMTIDRVVGKSSLAKGKSVR